MGWRWISTDARRFCVVNAQADARVIVSPGTRSSGRISNWVKPEISAGHHNRTTTAGGAGQTRSRKWS